MVWCGNGEGIIRSAHPALEYSYCGYQMVTFCFTKIFLMVLIEFRKSSEMKKLATNYFKTQNPCAISVFNKGESTFLWPE